MIVSDIMTRDLLTVPTELSVADGLARALDREVHHLLLVEAGRLKGVTCICELRERLPNESLRDCVRRAPIVIWAQCTLKQAAQRFIEKEVSFFPVCDGPHVVGVITRGDLRRSVVSEAVLPNSFRCKFCGSTRHVRPLHGDTSVPACLECTDRTAPAARGWYDEGAKG